LKHSITILDSIYNLLESGITLRVQNKPCLPEWNRLTVSNHVDVQCSSLNRDLKTLIVQAIATGGHQARNK